MPKPPPTSKKPRGRAGWWLLTGLSVGFVLVVTIAPQASLRQANWLPLSQSTPALKALLRSADPFHHPAFRFLLWQVVGNIVAFAPVGFSFAGLIRARGRERGPARGRWRVFFRAVSAGFLLSLTVETIQLLLPTRATDVDDLIFNTLGAALGAGLLLCLGPRRS
jgi:glycopeptide antibiotics resistance protein